MFMDKLRLIVILLVFFVSSTLQAQFLTDIVDTTSKEGKDVYDKLYHVKWSGFIQPQFQVAEAKGAASFNGGDFAPNANNRFMLRRGRIRCDYLNYGANGKIGVNFVFQFDGSERGVAIRDFWGRIFENKWHALSFTMGMFARPISYEVNFASGARESPERGRMSQILMKNERDMGAMLTVQPKNSTRFWKYIRWDAGVFNGQGLTATTDYDSYKDFVTRLSIKSIPIGKRQQLSAALSWMYGSILQNTKYVANVNSTQKRYFIDSTGSNLNNRLPRVYYEADLQYKINHQWGSTELRAEYIFGTQTATSASSESPAVLLTGSEMYYSRKFNGAYFYLLQNIINASHQLAVKYDWYDPNTAVSREELVATNGFTPADVKYATLGLGYIYYVNANLKFVLWYDRVKNEVARLDGFLNDRKDDVFTFRIQFRF